MEHFGPVDGLSNEELAAHLRTQHALVPRDIEDRDRMLALHNSAGPAAVVHDHDAGVQAPETSAPVASPSAWRGTVRLSGVELDEDAGFYVLVKLDAGGPPVGSVVTILPGDGLRG